MTGRTSAGRHRATDEATGTAAERRGVLRLFRRADPERPWRRAGADPLPAVLVSPRVWVALG